MKTISIALVSWTTLFGAAGQTVAPVTTSLGAYTQSLRAPARVATDPAGMVYVTEPQAGQVAIFDTFGRQIATHPGLGRPLGIAVDRQGRIYLADEASASISVFDGQWNFLYKLGTGDGEFQMPNHIAIDPDPNRDQVYVSDSQANSIKVYAGAVLTNQFGSAGQADGQFDFPAGICISSTGEVFVVDQNNDRTQVFNREGRFLRAFSLGTTSPSGRSQAAFLDRVGRFYVVDTFQGMVKIFDAASGAVLSSVGGFGRLPGQLASPAGLTMDALNRLFVASANTRRVELYGLDSFLHLTSQPAAGTIAAGTNLLFAVVAGGVGPFTFQWQKDGGAASGATNATFTIAGARVSDAGAYSVVVTGPSGSFTSGVTRVAVMVPPGIISQPQSQTVLRGSNVRLTVITEGSALSFQWQRDGVNMDGATNSTLELSDAQPFQTGLYSTVVSNAVGRVFSASASLTVLAPPSVMEILSFTMATNQLFHLLVNTDPGFGYSIEASDDLLQWQSLTNTILGGGLFEFIDLDSTNFVNRFYRLRWVP